MRIAIVNSYYSPDELGGAERSLRFLAEAAVAQGHECAVFTTGRAREAREINGVRVECFERHGPVGSAPTGVGKLFWHVCDTYSPGPARQMAAAIERFRPDVVHTNNLSGISVALWGLLGSKGMPIAHSLRDYYLMCPNTARFRAGRPCETVCGACRILGLPRLRATRHVATVIANSRFILDRHLRAGAFANAHCEVIYNAYRPEKASRARAAVPADRALVLGFIGRLAPSKGIERLIEAFRCVSMECPRPVLLYVAGTGEGEYEARLRALAAGLPVSFLGEVQPQRFYDVVDVTVVPSLWDEPLARVIFESFAHGVPVLASDRGGSAELVEPHRTGWLFDVGQPRGLETALLHAIRDCGTGEYERMSRACLTESNRFLPERVVERYLSALKATVH